jgi:AraC-like DNA-binding protein
MTKGPTRLLESPNHATDDTLTELFRAVRFTRCIYYTINAALPWPTIQVPVGPAIASSLGPRTQTVLSYHVVIGGSCWTGLEDGEPVKLERGDVIVYPRADAYFLAPTLGPRPASADVARLSGLLEGVASNRLPASFTFGPEGAEQTRFVCGFLGCDPRPFDPLLDALPHVLHIRGIDGRLKELVDLALGAVDGLGAASVRERLSESMFIETVRQHLAQLPPDGTGWLAGLRDPMVGRALALLHSNPAHGWTLASLAKRAGLSRSVLAERFAKTVGQPPMQYLARWRMQTAAHLLTQGKVKVAEVAREVGYDSEAAFSRAFKKATGVAPAAYTRQTTEGR